MRVVQIGLAISMVVFGASIGRAEEVVTDGFEQWSTFDSPAGNPHLERYVKEGWLGDQAPYRLPRVDFQMGPARVYCREGTPGKEVVSGKYALGVVSGKTPVNILTNCSTVRSPRQARTQVSAWLRGKGTVRFRIYAYNADNRCVDTPFIGTFALTPEWKMHKALYEPGKTDIKRWGVILEIAANSEVDIDDVKICPPGGGGKEVAMPPGMPEPVADSEKVVVAFPAAGAIQVEGSLTEEAWRKAEWHTGFLRHHDQTVTTPVQAQFAFLYDDQALYLGFAAAEGGIDAGKIQATAPGEWPNGDPVEWFLDPGATRDVYYQFAANLIGCAYEAKREDAKWNCEWKAAGRAEANRWTLEVRIPFKAFGRDAPKLGEFWTMNICRNGTFMGPWVAVGPRYHTPGGFGLLTFGTYAQWGKDGVVPTQERRLRELRTCYVKYLNSDPSLAAQMRMIEAGCESLRARMAKTDDAAINRKIFLELFHDADNIRILMDNLARECAWLQAMNDKSK